MVKIFLLACAKLGIFARKWQIIANKLYLCCQNYIKTEIK